MATEVKLPELGENIEEGVIVNVLVSVGDLVAKDDSIVEIETDKATLEVPSSAAGTVQDIAVSAGETVKVGQTLIVLASSAAPALDELKANLRTLFFVEKSKSTLCPLGSNPRNPSFTHELPS